MGKKLPQMSLLHIAARDLTRVLIGYGHGTYERYNLCNSNLWILMQSSDFLQKAKGDRRDVIKADSFDLTAAETRL